MSDLADLLAFHLRAAGIGGYEREYHFDPLRKWRADFAFIDARLLVEVDGAEWTGGAHVRGWGKTRDAEKDCEALIAGWRVMRVTGGMVRDGRALIYLERALGRPRTEKAC